MPRNVPNPTYADLGQELRDIRRDLELLLRGGLQVDRDIDLRGYRLLNVGNPEEFGNVATVESGTLIGGGDSGTGGSGDVTGPASSTDGNIATFYGTTGKQIQDSGFSFPLDHAALSNLDWPSSGHTGSANHVPYFDTGGAAASSSSLTFDPTFSDPANRGMLTVGGGVPGVGWSSEDLRLIKVEEVFAPTYNGTTYGYGLSSYLRDQGSTPGANVRFAGVNSGLDNLGASVGDAGMIGVLASTRSNSGNSVNTQYLKGGLFFALLQNGDTAYSDVIGGEFSTQVTLAPGPGGITTPLVTGLKSSVIVSDTGQAGVVTDALGVDAYLRVGGGLGGGSVTNATGARVKLETTSGGLITNAVGLRIDNVSGGTNNWAIQSAGGKSYHAGNLRIGSTVDPTVALDVTGAILASSSITGSSLKLPETGGGGDAITIQAPITLAAPYTLTLPVDDGDNREVLFTDGFGVTSWDGITGSDVTMSRIAGSTYSTAQHMQDIFHSAGRSSGGDVSAGTGNAVNVTAGTGFIRALDDYEATISFFDWPAATNLALPAGPPEVSYVGIEYNAGSPQAFTTASYGDFDFNTNFPLATVVVNGGLNISNTGHTVGDHANALMRRTWETSPKVRDARSGGLSLSDNSGSNPATRYIGLSAGGIWDGINRFPIPAFDTSGTDTVTAHYHASGAWTSAAVSMWDAAYDDPLGDKTALAANKYGTVWFYAHLDSDSQDPVIGGTLHLVYGTEIHNNLASAFAAPAPVLPTVLQVQGKLLGRFLVKSTNGSNEGTVEEVDSAFADVFAATQVNSHNDLGGLQGGTVDEYYHLTDSEYVGTGNGVVVRQSSPTVKNLLIIDEGGGFEPSLKFNTSGGGGPSITVAGATAVSTSLTLPSTSGTLALTSQATKNHTALSNLDWASSGHTGTATHVPFFNGSGNAATSAAMTFDSTIGELALDSLLVGTNGFISNYDDYLVEFSDTLAATENLAQMYGVKSVMTFTTTPSYTSTSGYGSFALVNNVGATGNSTWLHGFHNETTAKSGNSVTVNDVGGGMFEGSVSSGDKAAQRIFGTESTGYCNSDRTGETVTPLLVGSASKARAGSLCRGTINDAIGSDILVQAYGPIGATVTNGTGARIKVEAPNSGTITNAVGLRIDSISSGTNNYAIQSAGGQSYHAGSLRVGSTVDPTVTLDVTGTVKADAVHLGTNDKYRFDDGTGNEYSLFRNASNQIELRVAVGGVFNNTYKFTTNSFEQSKGGSFASSLGISTVGWGALYLAQRTTQPTPGANTAAVYGYDSGSGTTEVWVADEAGNDTLISPHSDVDEATEAGIVVPHNDPYPRVGKERNVFIGKEAFTYFNPITKVTQRVTRDLPPEEVKSWDDVQDQNEAARQAAQAQWDEEERAQDQNEAARQAEQAAWDAAQVVQDQNEAARQAEQAAWDATPEEERTGERPADYEREYTGERPADYVRQQPSVERPADYVRREPPGWIANRLAIPRRQG